MQFDYKRMQSFNILLARFYNTHYMLRQFAKDYKFDKTLWRHQMPGSVSKYWAPIIAGADMLFVSRGSTYSNEGLWKGD